MRVAIIGVILFSSTAACWCENAVLLPAQTVGSASLHPPYPTSQHRSAEESSTGQLVDFAPGVRIDFAALVVEVDARVVLRDGPLELLACSPQTREHESILAVPARPTHIFQAMGLIGLEPGAPARFDRKHDRWVGATGSPLRLEVRYRDRLPEQKQESVRTIRVEQWLYDLKGKREPESIDWVFAGSKVLPDGRFLADMDGTVVCVVDFASALIALGTSHSSSNEMLWLTANPARIPPVGTLCTLLIRGADTIVAELADDGRFQIDGVPKLAREIALLVKRSPFPACKVVILVRSADVRSQPVLATAVDALVAAGVDRERIKIRNLSKEASRQKHPSLGGDG